jgi:predicted DNA binding CopG/RHH family protein
MVKLNKEEKDLLGSYERGEWHSVKNVKHQMSQYQAMAKATLKKDKRVNIRISSQDLEGVQKKSIEYGIPYQTFIASIIHRYVSGALFEKPRHA